VDYLLWWVKGDRTPPLATAGNPIANPTSASIIGAPTTRVLFGGNSLGNDARSGIRINGGYWLNDNHSIGVDVSGFWLSQETRNFTASSAGNPQLGRPIVDLSPVTVNIFGQVVPNPLFGQNNVQQVAISPMAIPGVTAQQGGLAGSVSVHRKSNLWGAEANLRRNLLCGDFTVDAFVGFRTLGLDESLSISEALVATGNQFIFPPGQTPVLVTPAGTAIAVNDRFSVSNRFYGGQVGVDGEYHYGRWSLGAKLKVGLGNTQEIVDISGSTRVVLPPPLNTVTNTAGGLLAQPGTNIGHYSKDIFSVVPEAGVTVGYQITPHLRGLLGYNFLYWSNVVRPGDQIDLRVNRTFAGSSPVPPTGMPNPVFPFRTSDLWVQGLTVGLEFTW
jgi:hypothetical protein